MTSKEEKFLSNWEKTRANGKIRFLLTVSLVFVIILPLMNLGIDYFQSETDFVFSLSDLGVNAFVGFALGMFLGVTNWNGNEKKYAKLKEGN